MLGGVTVQVNGGVTIGKRLAALAKELSGEEYSELLDGIGAVVVSQTKRRIMQEKTTPDEEAWQPWSEEYAKTRKPHHHLLVDYGDLHEDQVHIVEGEAVYIGTRREYGAYQNAMRRWIGMGRLGSKSRQELNEAITAYLEGRVAGV